ncbi:TPA: type 1 fimbrial protein [Pseudomonas aeruginosa]|nr:type 1 fimbrial protein [Pseudomonas aeruginosa]HEH8432038.1 type 1 fimbrial protein [Pseudomonas aeruginosa]HEH8533589.1 type 1 fimbrial protein [Pseudomonas aeruginosa]HEH8759616.1 type 1 fimbrial protein [Pseudomonas aeruginosa]
MVQTNALARHRSLAVQGIALFGLAFLATTDVQAQQCTITSNTSSISFGTVTVPRDASIGTAIGPARTSSGTINCPVNVGNPNSGFYLQYFPKMQVSSTVAGVWETGMPGIGIRALALSYGNRVLSSWGSPSWDDFAPRTQREAYVGTYTFSYQLVKTAAQVTSGPINISNLLDLRSHNIPLNQQSGPQATFGVGNTTIVSSTCTVTTPQVNVTLPDVASRTLSPAGTTAGNTGFSVGLSCQTGSNVYVTLTDATAPSNRSNLLSPASGSTSTGVRLRLLKSDGTPIAYGPDSALPGNVNQWLVGGSDSTTRIPLTAQYISTGTVGPGIVRGIATFTMSYQ